MITLSNIHAHEKDMYKCDETCACPKWSSGCSFYNDTETHNSSYTSDIFQRISAIEKIPIVCSLVPKNGCESKIASDMHFVINKNIGKFGGYPCYQIQQRIPEDNIIFPSSLTMFPYQRALTAWSNENSQHDLPRFSILQNYSLHFLLGNTH